MYEQRTRRSNWALALPALLALGLALILTNWASAHPVAAPSTTITVNTEDDELNTDSDCSLREALQAANSDTAVSGCPAGSGWDTIVVPAGIYVLTLSGSGEDANASGDLDVLESVTIIGEDSGNTTIDGNEDDRVFHVDPTSLGVALELRSVAVTNGSSDAGGGLRAANGLTRIEDSAFYTNKASDSGGAIQVDRGTLRILDSTIENNRAGPAGDGGGIYVDVVALTIQDSTVVSNTARRGGGLFNGTGSVTLQDTAVVSNTVAGPATSGAGIFSWSGNLIIEDGSEIAYNRTRTTTDQGNGGAIWSGEAARLVIMDSWVHHNDSDGAGAGVYADGWGTYLRNSRVEHNSAGEEGGGLFTSGDLILVDSTVRHNHSDDATDGGGGMYALGDYGALLISNTLVTSNTTTGHGGGAYFGDEGGAHVINSVFRDNQADKYGGALYLLNQSGLIVENSAFEENRATYGGAICTGERVPVSIDASTFTGNYASIDGGALYLYVDSPADIRNSTFSQNRAEQQGGAIHDFTDTPNFGIQSSTIVSNSAGTGGGGIYARMYASVQDSIIAGNIVGGSTTAGDADCYAAAAFLSGGGNLLGAGTGCTATRYDQTIAPGALFGTVLAPLANNGGPPLPGGSNLKTHALLSGSPAIDAAWSDFCPVADERGATRPQGNACDIGAYESDHSAAVVDPSDHIIEVTTTEDKVANDGLCSLREAIQSANDDSAVGGCPTGDGWDTISLKSDTYTLSIAGGDEDASDLGDLDIVTGSLTIMGTGAATTIIDGDQIDRVLHALDGAVLLVRDLTITGGDTTGWASSSGGCLRSGAGLTLLVDTVVANCQTPGDGGGIYGSRGVGRLVSTVVKENEALSESGGLYGYRGVLSIRDSTIMDNTAAEYGGGLTLFRSSTRVSASDIVNNSVQPVSPNAAGGGINHDVGTLILDEGTSVDYNQAGAEGGGIYFDSGALKVVDSTVSHNYSSDAGGGLGLGESGLWLRGSRVEHNVTGGSGGGISYASGLIEDSVIRYNEALTDVAGGLDTWSIILNSTIADNEAEEAGGIWAEGVNLYNCVVRDNTALDGDGGGLYVQSVGELGGAVIVDSTFEGNSGTAGEAGAGAYAETMPITVRGSTFSGNSGAATGGAIYSSQGVVDLLNSTVSGNSATAGAGFHSGVVSLDFSTVADNSASAEGGGVYAAQMALFENSIVAGNEAPDSADCEAGAPATFGGHSLFGDGTGCAADGRADLTVSPATVWTAVLGPLADNGGPPTASDSPAAPGAATWTHALPPGSPALDAADTLLCPATDQRRVTRPQGAGCDMGALESWPHRLDVSVAGEGSGSVASDPPGISCTSGGGDCEESYEYGTRVTLSATADSGSTFAGWSGICTNASGDCVFTMNAAEEAVATFELGGYDTRLPYITKQKKP